MPAATLRQQWYAAQRGTLTEHRFLGLAGVTTRFYLPSSGAAPVSPAFNAGWAETGDAVRLTMDPTKVSTAMTTKNITAALAAQNTLFVQYVSAPLAAQTIAGAVKIQMRAAEALATGDAFSRILLKVVSNDGSSITGTLLTLADYSSGGEWNTSLRNKVFADGDTLTSVAANAGDRLVLEIGCNHAAVALALSLSIGDDNGSDLPEDETTTTALNPWLEFDSTITFQPTMPPGLGGILWQEDRESAARWAHYARRMNWGRAGESQSNAATEGLLQTTLLGQDRFYGDPGQSPTLQERWIVPAAYRRGISLRQLELGLVNTTLAGQDTFYGAPGQTPTRGQSQPHFPRRSFHQDHQRRGEIYLGQDIFYGDPGQAPTLQERWIVPKGYRRIESALALEVDLVNRTLLGQDLFFGDAGQAITFGQSQPYFALRPLHEQGWQTSTANLPIETAPEGLPTGLALSVLFPMGAPPRHPGWQQRGALILLGMDTFYGDPGQTPIFAISQPVLSRRPLTQDFTAGNIQGLALTLTIPPGLAGVLQAFDFDPAARVALGKALGYRQYQVERGLALVGRDIFYGVGGQAPTFGQSQPVLKRPPLVAQGWQMRPLTMEGADQVYGDPGQVVTSGISQRLRVYVPLHHFHISRGGQILVGQDVLYGAPGQTITFGQSQPYFAAPPLRVVYYPQNALSLLIAGLPGPVDGPTLAVPIASSNLALAIASLNLALPGESANLALVVNSANQVVAIISLTQADV